MVETCFNNGAIMKITMTRIRKVIAEHHGLSSVQICKKNAHRKFSHPRHLAMYFCRELTDASLGQIALFFGRADHTIVTYAYGEVVKRYTEDELMHFECKITGNFPSFREVQDQYKLEIKKKGL